MIKISEAIANKLPGLTSLRIKIEFNRKDINLTEIVRLLKSTESYAYDPTTKVWELPLTCLSYLLDNLTFYDDIDLTLLSNLEEINQKLTPKLDYKLKPFPYQMEAIEYGLSKDKWLLLDAPGLGKTATIIHIAEELKQQAGLEHCLIICGINTLKHNWKEEIKKHSDLDCIILGEKINSKGNASYAKVEDRAEQLKNPIKEFFIITNIETFRNDNVLKALTKGKNNIDMVVVDEVHKCKSQDSQQGKNLLKIKKPKYKIAATGTLLLNNPLDAYVPLKWIEVEKCNLTSFKNFYCEFGGMTGNQIIGFKNLNILKNQLATCSLRRTKDVLKDLPPKVIIKEVVEMNDTHKKFYEAVKDGVKSEVDKVRLSKKNLLSMVTRLRQATACPSMLTSNKVESSKIERAIDLAEEIISNGDKVVIFSTFKETVDILKEKLKEYKPLIMTGDMKDQEIFQNKSLFQENDNYKVLIGTWQKAGTGLTLTAASYMIFLDTPWTYAVFEQACDRIYRIGTEKTVFIYNLICKDTIDERVAEILDTKQAISNYIIDDQITEENYSILESYIENL